MLKNLFGNNKIKMRFLIELAFVTITALVAYAVIFYIFGATTH